MSEDMNLFKLTGKLVVESLSIDITTYFMPAHDIMETGRCMKVAGVYNLIVEAWSLDGRGIFYSLPLGDWRG